MHSMFHIVWGVTKHVAFGYLIYSLVENSQGRSPAGKTTAVLLFATVFPDLIDKTLTFAGIVGYGRSVAHSLFTATVLILVVLLLARRWNHMDVGTAFGIGYLSHIPVDMYGTLLTGHQSMDTAFLFWPVLVEYSLGVMTPEVPVAREVIFTSVFATAFTLWLYDRMPILSEIACYSYSRFSVSGEKKE